MSEQAILGAAEQALEPVAAAILEDLHAYASQELTHLGNTMPALLRSASQDVQDAFTTVEARYHSLIARIDAHRNGQVPPGFTAAPTTAPTSTTSSNASKQNSTPAASTATDTTAK